MRRTIPALHLRAFALLRVLRHLSSLSSPHQRLPAFALPPRFCASCRPRLPVSSSGALARVVSHFSPCAVKSIGLVIRRVIFADRFFRHLGLCSICFHASLSGALFLGFEIAQPFRFADGIFPLFVATVMKEGPAVRRAARAVWCATLAGRASRTEPRLPRRVRCDMIELDGFG